jgi:hypothetical protein
VTPWQGEIRNRDTWPVDFNADGWITLTDALKFIPIFNMSCTP